MESPIPAAAQPVPTPVQAHPPVKQGAVIGGWICFILGMGTMYLSLWLFFLYGPLLLVAFILSIVAMSQRRIAGGLILLLLSLVVPPITWLSLTASRGSAAVESAGKAIEQEVQRIEERQRAELQRLEQSQQSQSPSTTPQAAPDA
ncbi:MAG TPA: hypothetical protein VD994_01045 [Prosthecobacter sp.]|nr:hypothetical protein [Prosthecobacter sp.]